MDHLTVRGVCHGTTTIDRDLAITGIRPRGAAKPTLDGDQGGSTITIAASKTVTIATLTITDGSGALGGSLDWPGSRVGGGVLVHGTVTLRTVTVRDSSADVGGGLFIDAGGRATLTGSTAIRANETVSANGGGAYVYKGTLTMRERSRIVDNTSFDVGGGLVATEGTVTMAGRSAITGNHASNGGGAWLRVFSTLSMSGSSAIDHNLVTNEGGGVFIELSSTLTLSDTASIHDNSAAIGYGSGGGVIVYSGTVDLGALCGLGKAIRGNSPNDCTDQRG